MIPPQAYLFGDWVVPGVVVLLILFGFYIWAGKQ